MRWVKPNRDKPHRCPDCYEIAERAWLPPYGPRTRLSCVPCGTRWRPGTRGTLQPERYVDRLMQSTRWLSVGIHAETWLRNRENERHAA